MVQVSGKAVSCVSLVIGCVAPCFCRPTKHRRKNSGASHGLAAAGAARRQLDSDPGQEELSTPGGSAVQPRRSARVSSDAVTAQPLLAVEIASRMKASASSLGFAATPTAPLMQRGRGPAAQPPVSPWLPQPQATVGSSPLQGTADAPLPPMPRQRASSTHCSMRSDVSEIAHRLDSDLAESEAQAAGVVAQAASGEAAAAGTQQQRSSAGEHRQVRGTPGQPADVIWIM